MVYVLIYENLNNEFYYKVFASKEKAFNAMKKEFKETTGIDVSSQPDNKVWGFYADTAWDVYHRWTIHEAKYYGASEEE